MYERLQPKGLTGKILVVWITDHFGGRTWSLVCISTIDALQLVTHVLKAAMLLRKGCTKNQDLTSFNPLSPNSDQHQFSPNNIHTLSRD